MKTCIMIRELTREVGRPGKLFRTPFRAVEGVDHFPIPLSWRSFKLGASDYDIVSDEAYCPCGATVTPADDREYAMLGDFVDAAEAHIAEVHQ